MQQTHGDQKVYAGKEKKAGKFVASAHLIINCSKTRLSLLSELGFKCRKILQVFPAA